MQITVCGFCDVFKNETLTKVNGDLSIPLDPEQEGSPRIVSCPDCFPQAVMMIHKSRLATGLETSGLEDLLPEEDEGEELEDEDQDEGQEDEEEEEEKPAEEKGGNSLSPQLDHDGVKAELNEVPRPFTGGPRKPAKTKQVGTYNLTEYGFATIKEWGVERGIQAKMGQLKPATVEAYVSQHGGADPHVFA
ncbi:hypothetical protein ABZV14_05850 [Streptosporangium canum]|uniref:hypothetical protein n=1 Tax=Streptosporangium canum TaxID=324952 RepID=UPI0033BC96F5